MNSTQQIEAVASISAGPTPSVLPLLDEVDPTVSFFTNFVIGALIFLAVLVLYDLLRYYFPGHCYCREHAASNPATSNYDGSPLQSPQTPSAFPLSWVLPTIRYPLEKLIETHGLDTAMYMRFLQTQTKIFFALTLFTSVVLIPAYSTSEYVPSFSVSSAAGGVQSEKPRGLEHASLANVSDDSRLLWVTLFSEIVVVAIILIFLYRDIEVYTKYRIRYRDDSTKNPSNFAILIMDIPDRMRDQSYLFNVFNSLFPGQVAAVHPVRDAQHLLTLKTRYISAVNKRQRLELGTSTSTTSSSSPDASESGVGYEVFSASDGVTTNSKSGNQGVNQNCQSNHRETALVHPTRVRSVVGSSSGLSPGEQMEVNSRTGEKNKNETSDNSPHAKSRVGFNLESSVTIPIPPRAAVQGAGTQGPGDWAPINPISGVPTQSFADYGEFESASFDQEAATGGDSSPTLEERRRNVSFINNIQDMTSLSFQLPSPRLVGIGRSESQLIGQHDRQIEKARELLTDVEKDLERTAPLTHAAFVVFRSKIAATCAVTAPVFSSTSNFKISRAPDPRAINWNLISITRYTTHIREIISGGVLVALTLLWTIPSSFIQGLGNLSKLAETLDSNGKKFLHSFIRNNAVLASALEIIISPLLLFLLLLLIPQLMRFVISFERIPSKVQAENRVRNFLFFFYVMSNFVYVVGFGAIFRRLEEILENPREMLSVLSTTIPTQATFLMKYVLINSFLGSVLGMLNIGRLLLRPFLLWRAKTERDRFNADRLFADFPFTKMYAVCMMIALISYVYATIAPIMNAVAFVYFSIASVCTKQFMIYSHRPMFEGGGYLFRDAWSGLLIGLFIHQFAMIGIFTLKNSPVQAILASISLGFSIWFTILCRSRFVSRIENGSLLKLDEEVPINDGDGGDDLDLENGLDTSPAAAGSDFDIGGNMESTRRRREHPGLQRRHSFMRQEEALWDAVDEIPPHFINMYVHPGLKSVEVLEKISTDPATAALTDRSSKRRSQRPPDALLESFKAIRSL